MENWNSEEVLRRSLFPPPVWTEVECGTRFRDQLVVKFPLSHGVVPGKKWDKMRDLRDIGIAMMWLSGFQSHIIWTRKASVTVLKFPVSLVTFLICWVYLKCINLKKYPQHIGIKLLEPNTNNLKIMMERTGLWFNYRMCPQTFASEYPFTVAGAVRKVSGT